MCEGARSSHWVSHSVFQPESPVVPSLQDMNLSVKLLHRGAGLGAGLEPGTVGRVEFSQARFSLVERPILKERLAGFLHSGRKKLHCGFPFLLKQSLDYKDIQKALRRLEFPGTLHVRFVAKEDTAELLSLLVFQVNSVSTEDNIPLTPN